MFHLESDRRLRPLIPRDEVPARRQDITPTYALNGAIYVCDVPTLRQTSRLITEETIAYVMPPERSADVDTELDLCWCEFLIKHSSANGPRR